MIDAILAHPATGHATVAALRGQDGMGALHISHVAHPDLRLATPSGKVEFYSQRAKELGMPPLPMYASAPEGAQPLILAQGRTLTPSFCTSLQPSAALIAFESAQLWPSDADGVISGNKAVQISGRTFCTGNFAALQPISAAVHAKICKKVRVPAKVSNSA